MVSTQDRDARITAIDALLNEKRPALEQLGREIKALTDERAQLVDANMLDNARALASTIEARLNGRTEPTTSQAKKSHWGIRRRS